MSRAHVPRGRQSGAGGGAVYQGAMRDEARPLGHGRPTRQPISIGRSRNPPQSDALSRRRAEDDRPKMTQEELEQARVSHEMNLQRVKEASERQKARDQTIRSRAAQEEEDHRRRVQEQQRVYHETTPRGMPPPPRPSGEAKRSHPSMTTQTVTTSRISKAPRTNMNNEILVWQNNSFKDSLIDIALAEGDIEPLRVQQFLVSSCIQDGLTIRRCDSGYETDGLSTDDSMRSFYWKNLLQKITVEDDGIRAAIKSDGGTGCKRVGIGTFNAVVKLPPDKLPSWIPQVSVCRFTRSDTDKGCESKFQNAKTTSGEISNALFCSLNGIGPELYSISAFSAPRPCRTLRFSVAMCMQRAHRDLTRSLGKMATFKEGSEAAEACINLLFRASRLGVAFYDIKPGNMLQMSEDGNKPCYKLTDMDPAFLLRVEGRDWRALLLMNMSLLSVHVYNCDYGPVGRGWARTVAPMLRQLIDRKDEYDSKWLFLVRCVSVEFVCPLDGSDFQLQRLLCCMCESYFYGDRRKDALSYKWQWKNRASNQVEVDRYWETEANKSSWPPSWNVPDPEPLIKQLVDLALKYA